jgi:hypothetical protein
MSNLDRPTRIAALKARAIDPSSVVAADRRLTKPRTWGVYEVDVGQRYRMGNHPIRLDELQRETGRAKLVHLFSTSNDAQAMKALLNIA